MVSGSHWYVNCLQMAEPRLLRDEIAAAGVLAGPHLAKLTSKFVAVPSVNGEHPEVALVDVIAAELEPHGFELHRVGRPERPSLAAVLGTHSDDDSVGIVLNGHLDTVPVDDAGQWRYPPFAGTVAAGAIHGRGACDMKGGLAVMVAVGQWLASRSERPGRLVLHFAMGEERGEPGTESLLEAGFVAPKGIVLEPTQLQIGIAQRGLVTLRISIQGRAGHASSRELADNPVLHVPAVLQVLGQLEADNRHVHPLLGTGTWTPTSVQAGVIPSMIPATCEVLIDRRMVPGDTVSQLIRDLEAALASAAGDLRATVSVVEEEGIYKPAEIPRDAEMVRVLESALGELGQEPVVFGTAYASDVRHLVNEAGIEAVTFGPGRFNELHARDEKISVSELELGTHAVALAAAQLTVG